MANATNFLEKTLLNGVLKGEAVTFSTPYIGLMAVAPNDSGGGDEISAASYSRKAVANTDFQVTDEGAASNTVDFVFDPAEEAWGTVTSIALFDSATGGNMLIYTTITSTTIDTGDILKIPAGGFTVNMD